MKKTIPRNEERHYIYKYPTKVEPENIVRALLSGIDIIFVDPELYSYIFPVITTFKEKYIEEDEPELVEKLEFLEKYISNYPKRKQRAEMIKTKEPVKKIKKQESIFTEDELKEEIEYILGNSDFKSYSAEQATELCAGMRAKREQFISEREYLMADKAESLINKLTFFCQVKSVKELQDKRADDLTSKIKEAEENLQESKKKWEELFAKMQFAARSELKNIEDEHNKELERIEKLREESPPPSIAKYSNTLLDCRAKEEAMKRIKNFSGAADMKDKADLMQAEENHQFIVRWNKKIDGKINAENKAYSLKLNSRILFWKKEESNMIMDANNEIGKAEKAIENMKENLSTVKYQKRVTKSALNQAKASRINTRDINERQTPVQHRQRAIINKRIYTMTARKRPESSQLPSYQKRSPYY